MTSTTHSVGAVALRSWLDANSLSARAFAEEHEMNIRSVQQWASGKTTPRAPAAMQIQKATDGVVSMMLWGVESKA